MGVLVMLSIHTSDIVVVTVARKFDDGGDDEDMRKPNYGNLIRRNGSSSETPPMMKWKVSTPPLLHAFRRHPLQLTSVLVPAMILVSLTLRIIVSDSSDYLYRCDPLLNTTLIPQLLYYST
jgi:hypothetical protein